MKNVIKNMVSLLLTLVLLTCAFAVCGAAEEDNSHLWVGGEYVEPENAADPFGDGTVSFDLATNTLTLNNYKYEGAGIDWEIVDGTSHAAIIYDGNRDLTLVLVGENSAICTGGADYSYGVTCVSNLTVTGTGTLDAVGGGAKSIACGIYATADLVINGGTINAEAVGKMEYSYGIHSEKLTVNGGTVNARSDKETPYSCGIHSSDVKINDGVINAESRGEGYAVGIYGAGFDISGGVITAKGGKTNDYSAGIYSTGDFTMTGGTLTATGDTANKFSDGIYVGGNFAINGGVLTAAGGTAAEYSTGLYFSGDTADFSGGTVTLTGGDAGNNSCGINEAYTSKKDIRIGKNITSLSLSGKGAATTGIINSATGGVGYENADKTGEKSFITPDEAHGELGCKLVEFPHGHTLTKVGAKQPTNRETGNIEYYVCSGCDGYFKDADGKIYIEDKNSVIIPALGDEDVPEEKSGFPWVWVIIAVVLAAAAAAAAVIIIKKKRK